MSWKHMGREARWLLTNQRMFCRDTQQQHPAGENYNFEPLFVREASHLQNNMPFPLSPSLSLFENNGLLQLPSSAV